MSVTKKAGLQVLDMDDLEAGVMAYSVGGKITTEEAQVIWDRVETAAADGKKLRLYYEMESFPTSEAGVLFDKMKHMGALLKTIERLAIVGDQGWLKAYTTVINPITKMDIRHFTTEDKDTAVAWIRE